MLSPELPNFQVVQLQYQTFKPTALMTSEYILMLSLETNGCRSPRVLRPIGFLTMINIKLQLLFKSVGYKYTVVHNWDSVKYKQIVLIFSTWKFFWKQIFHQSLTEKNKTKHPCICEGALYDNINTFFINTLLTP